MNTPPVKPRVTPRRKPAAPAQPAAAPVVAHPADASPRSTQVLDGLLHVLPSSWRPGARDALVLMRMDRPVGALLLLWPTWWALWLARRDFPPVNILLIFTAGVFLMRAAGCVINDYADRWLDPQVERTRGRPLAAGRISPRTALLIFCMLMLMAFGLVLLTNALTIKLSLIGAGLATLYPFTKRYTHLPQVVLGAAFGWSIPMAFAAVNGNSGDWQHALPPLCWLLFLANVLWATIYDTEYAMVDRDEDIRAGARSTAILFGDLDLPIIGMLMGSFVITMLMVGSRAQLHWVYAVAVGAAAGLFAWQQWILRDRSQEHCFAAFRNNQWVGLSLWVGICMAVALR